VRQLARSRKAAGFTFVQNNENTSIYSIFSNLYREFPKQCLATIMY